MKRNKFLICIAIFLIIIAITFNFESNATVDSSELTIYSDAAIIMERSTGKILYEKNAYKKMYPASTTKVMTAILTLENCELSDKATVSYNAIYSIPSGYTNANLQLGEELTIEQLLYCLLLPSANDAAIVLAEHIAGSVESFSAMMNTKAAEIGCKNTNFVNPNGIHNDNHYSTAYDLCLIGQYAMKNPTFKTIVTTTTYTLPATNKYPKNDRVFNNTNDLIRVNNSSRADNYYYQYATGVKTGYTKYAKNCLVASSSRDNLDFILVILGAGQTSNGLSQRYLDAKTLFNFGYDNYTIKQVKKKDSIVKNIEIAKATRDTRNLDLLIDSDINTILEKNNELELVPEIKLNENLKAPISKGDTLGTISYTVDEITYSANLIAANNVEKSNILGLLLKVVLLGIILFLLYKITTQKKTKKRYKTTKARNIHHL